jgi:PadR family transcriptional regulator, regulatory protein AphA
VLGLLTFGERSGYDLLKLAEQSVGFFWTPARSQLYALLPKLVERGLARSRRVRQQRRPDKQLYTITPAGERALRQGLEQRLGSAINRNPFALKLFFGAHRDPARVRAGIEGRMRAAEQHLRELEQIEANLDTREHFFPYLSLLDGVEDAKAKIRFGKRALALLDEYEPGG